MDRRRFWLQVFLVTLAGGCSSEYPEDIAFESMGRKLDCNNKVKWFCYQKQKFDYGERPKVARCECFATLQFGQRSEVKLPVQASCDENSPAKDTVIDEQIRRKWLDSVKQELEAKNYDVRWNYWSDFLPKVVVADKCKCSGSERTVDRARELGNQNISIVGKGN